MIYVARKDGAQRMLDCQSFCLWTWVCGDWQMTTSNYVCGRMSHLTPTSNFFSTKMILRCISKEDVSNNMTAEKNILIALSGIWHERWPKQRKSAAPIPQARLDIWHQAKWIARSQSTYVSKVEKRFPEPDAWAWADTGLSNSIMYLCRLDCILIWNPFTSHVHVLQ